jgi:uncharacterized Tic20 family protein
MESTSEERNWAMACHLASFAGYVIPMGNIIGPLVAWLMKREELPLVDDQGKEALNFQISMTIYLIISAILILVVIGAVMLLILGVLNIVFPILAAIAANRGERYRYPLCIRFVK